MHVQKEAFRGLLKSLGYPADDWDDKRMLMKARTLKEVDGLDEKAKDLSAPDAEMLKDVLTTTRKGKKVRFEDGQESEDDVDTSGGAAAADGVGVNGKKGAKKVASNKGSNKVKVKTKSGKASANGKASPADRDQYGSRKGSDAAKVNAALSASPQTLKELADKTGVRFPINQIRKLVSRGVVVRGDDGYKLKSGKKAAAK